MKPNSCAAYHAAFSSSAPQWCHLSYNIYISAFIYSTHFKPWTWRKCHFVVWLSKSWTALAVLYSSVLRQQVDKTWSCMCIRLTKMAISCPINTCTGLYRLFLKRTSLPDKFSQNTSHHNHLTLSVSSPSYFCPMIEQSRMVTGRIYVYTGFSKSWLCASIYVRNVKPSLWINSQTIIWQCVCIRPIFLTLGSVNSIYISTTAVASLVPRLHSPAFLEPCEKSWGVEPGNEASNGLIW